LRISRRKDGRGGTDELTFREKKPNNFMEGQKGSRRGKKRSLKDWIERKKREKGQASAAEGARKKERRGHDLFRRRKGERPRAAKRHSSDYQKKKQGPTLVEGEGLRIKKRNEQEGTQDHGRRILNFLEHH